MCKYSHEISGCSLGSYVKPSVASAGGQEGHHRYYGQLNDERESHEVPKYGNDESDHCSQ